MEIDDYLGQIYLDKYLGQMLQKVHLRRAWRGGVAGARAGLEGLGWVWRLGGAWQAGASLATLRWQVFKCYSLVL